MIPYKKGELVQLQLINSTVYYRLDINNIIAEWTKHVPQLYNDTAVSLSIM